MKLDGQVMFTIQMSILTNDLFFERIIVGSYQLLLQSMLYLIKLENHPIKYCKEALFFRQFT